MIWVSLMVSSFTVAAVFIVYIYAVVRTALLCVTTGQSAIFVDSCLLIALFFFYPHTLMVWLFVHERHLT